jgi:hypothetical protein
MSEVKGHSEKTGTEFELLESKPHRRHWRRITGTLFK